MLRLLFIMILLASTFFLKGEKRIEPNTESPTVDILFLFANYDNSNHTENNYTPKWEIDNKVKRNIQEANQVFVNSAINMRFRSVGIEEVSLSPSQMKKFRDRILNSKNLSDINKWTYPDIKPIFDIRFEKKADVVVFIDIKNLASIVNSANVLGGKLNPYVRINNGDFNTGIFLHEVCHLFGLTHEMGASLPYDPNQPGKRSIMAVNCAQVLGDNHKKYTAHFSGINSFDNGVHFYSECNWDSATVLNEIATEVSQWSEEVKYGDRIIYNFAPAPFKDISTANECTSYGIDINGRLWYWDRYKWKLIETEKRFKSVTAKDWENVFLVDDNGQFITYNTYTKVFGMIQLQMKIKDIATNTNGEIYILSDRNFVYYRYVDGFGQNNWKYIDSPPNKIKDIQLTDKGDLWALDEEGAVLEYSHNFFVVRTRMLASELSVGRDGTVGIINKNDSKIYIAENGSYFFKQRNNNVPSMCNCKEDLSPCQNKINFNMADKLSVFNTNRIWAIAGDRLYKYVGQNGFQEVREYGQKHKSRHIN